MKKSMLILATLALGLALSPMNAGRVEAKNDCFISCGMISQGCMAGLHGDRRECKLACKSMAPGPGRGHCKSACAHVPKGPKQECKIARDRCRSECDHPNACGFACSATGRECFMMTKNAGTECRMDCRTEAEAAAAACATAVDPEVCLEAVAEARGVCLDLCGIEQGAALEACGMAFQDCKDACHPNDPNEPDGEEPSESPGEDDDD